MDVNSVQSSSRVAVFVHGMWSKPWVWDRWKVKFEEQGYACVTLSLPGRESGAGDSALCGVGLRDYAAAVEAVARRYERPVLVGHSLGGLIVQQVAARVALSAAVLVCSAAPAPIFPQRPAMLPGLIRHFAKPNLWSRSFRLSRWEADYLLFNCMPEVERSEAFERLIGESGRIAFEVAFGALNLGGTNRVEKSNIHCPMLAMSGVKDQIIPISVSRKMWKWYCSDKMDYREYVQHAHWMLGEPEWDRRVSEILTWLKRL